MSFQRFQVTAKVTTINEDGDTIVKSQNYILDAFSFIEAETRIHEIFGDRVIDITAIKGVAYTQVYDSSEKEHFFSVSISELSYDEVSRKEKKHKFAYLIAADNLDEAKQLFQKHYTMLPTTVITSIKQTDIIEYFPVKAEITITNTAS